jgi:hypothetical protein
MGKIEYADITPHKSLMPKIGRSGYTVPQAIAELIDNSIDAKVNDKVLNIDIEISNESIEITDNGTGMSKEELIKAFSLAHSSKEGKLGEFGLGLKTSCQSLGEYFSITTCREEDKEKYQIDYDVEEWLKNDKHSWSKYPIKILKKEDNCQYGTVIKIEKLNKQLTTKTKYAIQKTKEDIGNRFSPFILGGEVVIKINGVSSRPIIPELTDDGKTEFEITPNGNKIHGWYGLMKTGSPSGFYGFNVFRRGRMITCYDKIGIPDHATVSKIVGEIHLDFVPVTHNKREFIKDSEEYLISEESLSKEFKDLVRKARNSAKDDKVTKKVKQEVDIWKERIAEAFKSKDLKDLLGDNSFKGDSKGGKEEKEEIEKRAPWKLETPPLEIKGDQKVMDKSRKPKKTHQKKHRIAINGKKFDFNVDYAHLGPAKSSKDWAVSKEKGIEVVINTDFPAWLATKDTPFYVVFLISEALAEIICKENEEYNPERISEIKEGILRKSSQFKDQFEEEVEEEKDKYREGTSPLKKEDKNAI